jgi:hypothetical protein
MYRTPFSGRGRNGEITWVETFWGDDSSSYGMQEFGITHWMDLPPLPEGK